MLIAHDEKGNRVSIDKVKQGEKYFCPICGFALNVKNKGKKYKPYFAHKVGKDCDWGDMSEWHISWQEKFPEENREVIIEKDGVKHRADVLIPSEKTVIEFQHSAISAEEFNARNQFYTDCGYRLVWVFDATNRIRPLFDDECLETLSFDYRYDTWCLMWKRRNSTFTDYATINKGRSISILLDVEMNQGEKALYIVKNMEEKIIDVFSFHEPIFEQNFLRTYGVLKDKRVLTMKQIANKTNQIIEIEKQKQKEKDYREFEDLVFSMGVRNYFKSTGWLNDYFPKKDK